MRGLVFRFTGVTQWTDGRKLVGVRFVDLTWRRKSELADALGEVQTEIAAKARERAAQEGAARKLADEIQPAVQQMDAAGLRKTDIHPQAQEPAPPGATQIHLVPKAAEQPGRDAATAAESDPDASPLAKPSRQERRAQSRHEVDTKAFIFLINIGCRVTGRIVDVYKRQPLDCRLPGQPGRAAPRVCCRFVPVPRSRVWLAKRLVPSRIAPCVLDMRD